MTCLAEQPHAALAELTAAAIHLEGVGKWIDERPILRGIDLEVRPGELVGLLGANGAGKSTLLKILALLTPTSEGQVHLLGRPAERCDASLRRRIGLVGHQPMVYGELSALENLLFFARLYGVTEPKRRALQMLDRVGLSHRSADAARTFSRGMIQRLAVARALLHEPELILADEPFTGLDAPGADALERMLIQLHGEGKTILLVNHDIHQTLRVARRIAVLREGRLVADEPAAGLSASALLAEVSGS